MADPSSLVRSYSPRRTFQTPIRSIAMAWREIYVSRHVIWQLFARDFVANLRQKVLGYLWVIITPLLAIASFVFLNYAGVLNPGEMSIPYPLFVYIGTSLWALLMATITTVANGLIGNSDLIIRTNIPKIGLSLTGLANVLYNYIVGVVLLLVVFAFFRLSPHPGILLYPIVSLPIIALGVGVGLVLAVVGTVARDVTPIAVSILGLLMYVTPVVFNADLSNPVLRRIIIANPLTYLVDTPRSLATLGVIPSPIGYFLATLLSLVMLWIGIHAFYLVQDKVAERL
ncbi:ABC transporter permease [Cyanobium sp. N5-Cardenillas]|jgi:lipopolysaccharide transport system permease protein|uniref:ABC transporter permease n=1 Tax=Cyanobium sp. N5-Cardenillas TaxID=2823720 RepID=UPI0020CF6181|nr:ABC transporter permease [Cyanobium sp. N5-Cardenillas]MCP9784748.1 ABC transporter permease [Cyanobium sp. N5-Cardenillas]